MSTASHRAWGWRWLEQGHRRHWPYFVTRLLNDVGNYGFRGTFRERVVRGICFWFRNRIWWKTGLHKVYASGRIRWSLPFKPGELRYSQRTRCRCGAGLAYWPPGWHLRRGSVTVSNNWLCADVLTGNVEDSDAHDCLPFMMYEVRSEDQPNRGGVKRKVLFGILGERYATCREIGDSTRFPPTRRELV